MPQEDLQTIITSALQQMLEPHGFGRPHSEALTMNGWWFCTESDEFTVTAGQQRSGDGLRICIGSRIRRRPRAHMRGPWSLSHLRGFAEGSRDHYPFQDPAEQLAWMQANIDKLLNTRFLNSDELNTWAVRASRRLFRQKTI